MDSRIVESLLQNTDVTCWSKENQLSTSLHLRIDMLLSKLDKSQYIPVAALMCIPKRLRTLIPRL